MRYYSQIDTMLNNLDDGEESYHRSRKRLAKKANNADAQTKLDALRKAHARLQRLLRLTTRMMKTVIELPGALREDA